jgi:hypothetical protein
LDIKINWGIVSAVIVAISASFYVRDVYKRTCEKPVITSWLLWVFVGAGLAYYSESAGSTIETTLLSIILGVINPLIILVLAIKYGTYAWTKIDTWCVIVCVATILARITIDSVMLGIYGLLFADLIAAIPQIKKSWTDPKDESPTPWVLFAIGSAVNMLSITEWEPRFYAHPLYMVIGSTIIFLPIVLHQLGVYKNTCKNNQHVA